MINSGLLMFIQIKFVQKSANELSFLPYHTENAYCYPNSINRCSSSFNSASATLIKVDTGKVPAIDIKVMTNHPIEFRLCSFYAIDKSPVN